MGCSNTKQPLQTVAIDLSSTSIGAGAWVELLEKLFYAAGSVEIFNGSSSAFALAVGGAGDEQELPYTVVPGGTNGSVFLSSTFKAADRISAKSIGGVPTQGLLIFNFYG